MTHESTDVREIGDSGGDVLERAADLIEPEGAWTTEYWAKTEDGSYADPGDADATCWCVRGAVARAAGITTLHDPILNRIEAPLILVIGTRDTAQWNDAPGRTQTEVVSALRKAAAIARAGGQP